MPSVLEIARLNLGDDRAGLIEEANELTPEVTGVDSLTGRAVPNEAEEIDGLAYYTKVRIAVPTGGGFRAFGAGASSAGSQFANRLFQCKPFDKLFWVDKMEAQNRKGGWQRYLAEEALGVVQAGLQDWSKQFYYGDDATFGDSDGPPGLLQGYDTSLMEVDAGGTTANTGSSVWAVKFGPMDVKHLLGNNVGFTMTDVREQYITDPNDITKQILALAQSLQFFPGLSIGHKHSVGRIKKLTEDSGKGLTAARMGALCQKFIENRKALPDVFFATPRSIEQLRVDLKSGLTIDMEMDTPTSYRGIPLVATTGILNTEALTL